MKGDFYIGYEASLLKNIFHNSSLGIIETDVRFMIRLANPAAARLLNEGEDMVGLPLTDFIDEKQAIGDVADQLLNEKIRRFEGKLTACESKYRQPFKVTLTLSRDDFFMVTGFLVMCEQAPIHSVCCVCKKVRTTEGWLSLEELLERSASLSHTYCPECLPKAIDDIRARA